ncbi:acyl-CoA reductase-like NAD-dependent aldehyde dehydrogenase/nicotinamidase-related amidase [Methylohalomonas lacus]|uniref:Acyl-CoA reductase-like NAD-dependent aldehyde dehydrogenase/nicotinamidase-related amidase n=1 Tax=Methylohalomonas lacus TaxID=398773 RepID=A0AAE3L4S3_9GAMM|nr:aldehyde dehydrogenase family protein [Methylohalomonas lacus]MCS3904358.1 acyl-CoA reductase-like NAD-dependent aldehyde dehydrogenase/nicotinamidase-related amidase [Methylohalomonas lacus]
MTAALLLIDAQNDFLAYPGIEPEPAVLIERLSALLGRYRALGLPVFHIHTVTHPWLDDAMPHWLQEGRRLCVAGTAGCQPPAVLAPVAGDAGVFSKTFHSAFNVPGLEQALAGHNVQCLILAGLFLHVCVRETAVDAYARGYRITIAADATGSYDSTHAEVTRSFLQRFVSFDDQSALLARLDRQAASHVAESERPVTWSSGCIDGQSVNASQPGRSVDCFNPVDLSYRGRLKLAGRSEVVAAVAAAAQAAATWETTVAGMRRTILNAWRESLDAARDEFVELLAEEIGKPLRDGHAEMDAAAGHLTTVIEQIDAGSPWWQQRGDGWFARRRPYGAVALITPWNNPVAIAVGKIAPAVACGNSVVWKASPRAPAVAQRLMASLLESGMPGAVVNLLLGEADVARMLAADPAIRAVSLTGSMQAGSELAVICGRALKPLHAELGGNNAALVMSGADLGQAASELARAGTSFAGQRCTAIRRIVVHESLLTPFVAAMRTRLLALRLGSPLAADTDIGPLLTPEHRQTVRAAIDQARADGAVCHCGGEIPDGLESGGWLTPALLQADDPALAIVQRETFGPVMVVQPARDIEHALELANGVDQGLAAAFYGTDPAQRARFMAASECGLLRFDQSAPGAHRSAPFSGWKRSGLGPPEHGAWDMDIYTRIQTVYGDAAGLEEKLRFT